MQGFAICSTLPARSEVFACKGVCWYCLQDDPRWKMTYHHYYYYYHLAPHEKPWSFYVLNAGPGPVSLVCTTRVGGCLEKGCATCSGLGGRRGRGGGRGATDLRGSARIGGPSLARLWLGQGVQGPGTTCKTCMARPARATWCTHTAILSSQLSTAQTYHIHRPLSSLISKLHLKKPQDYSYIVMSTICVW